jgi:hypothetical protein
LPADLQQILEHISYKPSAAPANIYDDTIRQYAAFAPEMRARAAAGLFLQGRMCSVLQLWDMLRKLKFAIGRLREIVDQHQFKTPDECVDFFMTLFQSNLGGFFFRSLEHSPRFHDYIYGPDAFMRVEGFCDEISQYTAVQVLSSRVRAPIPFADLRFPHIVLAHAVASFRGQITKQWIIPSNIDNSMDQRCEWLFPTLMIVASVVWLIRFGDLRGIDRRFTVVWRQIVAARSYLTPPLQEMIATAEETDAERAPIQAIVMFLVNRVLPTLLIGILLSDKSRTEAKVAEYVLSVAEIVRLAPFFQPGVLVGRSLVYEIWQQLEPLFPSDGA